MCYLWKVSNSACNFQTHISREDIEKIWIKSSPHTDEDISITENEEENILLGDIMEVGALLVGEE